MAADPSQVPTDTAEPVELSLAPGFFSEQTDRGAKDHWKDGNRVRFKNGLPQKLGGWVEAGITGETLQGIDRRELEWSSLDGQPWIAQGTTKKLYLINRGVRYDITPVRRNASLIDPFTTTSGSVLVTVVDVDHGAQQGDFVRFSGATAVGGVTVDGEYEITSVQDGSNYTITVPSPASSSATGGGNVAVEYDISVGLDSASQAHGYGTCTYGTGTYGTRRGNCSNIILPLRIWSLDNWGEDLIASPRGGAVYWWDRTTGPTSRAVLLDQAPRTNEHVLVSDSGDQIICLGAYDDLSGTADRMLIRVGAVGSLTDFTIPTDPTVDTTVFEERLSSGSYIISGVRTRGGIWIATDIAQYFMQPDSVNGFTITKLGEGNSPIGPNSFIDVDGTVYAMADGKFMKFDGVYNEIPCPVWGRVFDSESTSPDPLDPTGTIQNGLSSQQGDKVYCYLNKQFGEVWWLYPSPDQATRATVEGDDRVTVDGDERAVIGAEAENDRYVILNYGENLWYYGVIERTAMSTGGIAYGVPFGADPHGGFFLHETGMNDDINPMNEYIESYDVQTGNGKSALHISQFVPDMKRILGTLIMTLKAKNRPQQGAYVVFGPYSFTGDDALVGVRSCGRQMAVRFSSDALDTDWRLGGGTFYGQPDGDR